LVVNWQRAWSLGNAAMEQRVLLPCRTVTKINVLPGHRLQLHWAHNEEAEMAAMKAGFAYAFALLGVIIAIVTPASADKADLKKQVVEQNYAPYLESFNKQDVASLVALYASGAVVINAAGPYTDIPKFLEGTFKAGISHLENTLDQVWPLGGRHGARDWHVSGHRQEPERRAHRCRGPLDRNVCSRGREVEDTDVVDNSVAAARQIANPERPASCPGRPLAMLRPPLWRDAVWHWSFGKSEAFVQEPTCMS
jgi:hypothetical protein